MLQILLLEGACDLITFLRAYYRGFDKATECISKTILLNYEDVRLLSLAELL